MGLEKAGFKTRVAIETNKNAVATIEANRKTLPVIDFSIKDATTDHILKKAKLSVGEATIVAGGPCCQSFSTAGKRGSLGDPRGSLFMDFCRVVRDTRPRFFIMENVKGLLSAAIKHRPLDERGPGFPALSPEEELGSAFKVILRELSTLGYYIVYSLVNTADYGTPQIRHRVLIIGSRDGETISIPKTTHSKDGENGNPKWNTLGGAIRGIKSQEWVKFSEKALDFLGIIAPGECWTSLPKRLQKKALGAAYDSWGGRKGFYRRLSWDSPSPSLTTAPDGKATMLCHPTNDRPLSVEEYAKIQEFPSGYIFKGSIREKYTMIGNAVPLSLGHAVGAMLRATMKSTARQGLPAEAKSRKWLVVCGDPLLEKRLSKRRKTQMHPPHLRSNSDTEAGKEWLSRVGERLTDL